MDRQSTCSAMISQSMTELLEMSINWYCVCDTCPDVEDCPYLDAEQCQRDLDYADEQAEHRAAERGVL